MALDYLVSSLSLLIEALAFVLVIRLMRASGRQPITTVLLCVILFMVLHETANVMHTLQGGLQNADVISRFIDLVTAALILLGVLVSTRMIRRGEKTVAAAASAEARYRTLLDQSPDGILLLDTDGNLIDFNDQACLQLGYARDEFAGLRIEDIDIDDDRERVLSRMDRIARTGKTEFEVRHRTKGGEIRDVLVIAQTVELSGRLYHHSIWRDITERKRAEAAVRQCDERFRTIFDNASDGILITDGDTRRFVEVNRSMCDMLGYTREELLDLGVGDIHPPQDLPAALKAFEKAARNGAGVFEGLPVTRKDGSIFYADIGHTSVTLRGKRCAVSIFRDITEQKQTAAELSRYRRNLEDSVVKRTTELQSTVERLGREIGERIAVEKELKTNRQFLRSILNSIQDPIMVLDRNLHLLMMNGAFKIEFLGGQDIRFVEGTCHEVFYGISRSCPNCLSKIAMSTGAMASRAIIRGEGEARKWFEIYAFPLAMEDGKLIGSVHHMRDITARKETESQIEQYQERLRTFAHQLISTEERERRRIALALHDGFPQKLALSKMLLQDMQSRFPGNAATDTFARIDELYDDMTREVRALTFELSPPVLYEVGLEPALERLLRNMLSDSRMKWQFENWRGGPPLRGELATVLYAIVRELVMNAVKYAQARFLKVTLAEWAGMILAVVQDDGKGMPQGAARRELRQKEMRGFGLFSVRERLHHLHGRLAIETAPGKGTVVRIEVPGCETWTAGPQAASESREPC